MMNKQTDSSVSAIYELLNEGRLQEVLQNKEIFLEKEKQSLLNAISYALDEDGHTGDWKIKFANDYYSKKFKPQS
jgi:hypothetical protein